MKTHCPVGVLFTGLIKYEWFNSIMYKWLRWLLHILQSNFHHTIQRKYIALRGGDFAENEGTVVAHVGRNQRYRKFLAYPEGEHGKEVQSHYSVLERFNYVTLIEMRVVSTTQPHRYPY